MSNVLEGKGRRNTKSLHILFTHLYYPHLTPPLPYPSKGCPHPTPIKSTPLGLSEKFSQCICWGVVCSLVLLLHQLDICSN